MRYKLIKIEDLRVVVTNSKVVECYQKLYSAGHRLVLRIQKVEDEYTPLSIELQIARYWLNKRSVEASKKYWYRDLVDFVLAKNRILNELTGIAYVVTWCTHYNLDCIMKALASNSTDVTLFTVATEGKYSVNEVFPNFPVKTGLGLITQNIHIAANR